MSTQKILTVGQYFAYSAVPDAAVPTKFTFTTAVNSIAAADLINLEFSDSPQGRINVAVATAPTSSSFTVSTTDPYFCGRHGFVRIPYFNATGYTPIFSISKSQSAPSVIQFTAHGTGAPVCDLYVSNDQKGWVKVGTITNDASDGDTQFVTIAPMWCYAKVNITSIGASTSLTITACS